MTEKPATCETHGHIFGYRGQCLFCGIPKPVEMSIDELKHCARKAIDAGELMIDTLREELQEAQTEIERLRGELAATKADTERLDWLLKNSYDLHLLIRADWSGEKWRAWIDTARTK